MSETAEPKQTVHFSATLLALFALCLSLFTLGSLNHAGLVAAALSTGAATYLLTRCRADPARQALSIALATLVLLGAVEMVASWQVAAVRARWPAHGEARQAETYAKVGAELDQAIQHAALVARRAADAATLTKDTAALFHSLTGLFRDSRVDAIALFGPLGELTAWAGEHKAPIPERVRLSDVPAIFIEQSLYSYLYRAYRLPNGEGYAVAAVLLLRTVHGTAHEPSHSGMAEMIAHADGSVGPGAGPARSWPVLVAGGTIAHLTIPLSSVEAVQSTYLAAARSTGLVLGILAFAFLLIAIRRTNVNRPQRIILVALAPLALVATPWPWHDGAVMYLAPLEIPVGVGISVSTWLAVLTSVGFLLATIASRTSPKSKQFVFTVGATCAVTAIYVVCLAWLLGPSIGPGLELNRAASSQLLTPRLLWSGIQFAPFLSLAFFTVAALVFAPAPRVALPTHRSLWTAAAFASSAAFAAGIIIYATTYPVLNVGWITLWAIPIALAITGAYRVRSGADTLRQWILGGWIAGTAVLSFTWAAHIDARRDFADIELQSLGPGADPYLEYLLLQFAREVQTRGRDGETGARMLYRSWLASGIANTAYPVRLTLWSAAGVPQVQLALGGTEAAQLERPFTPPRYLSNAMLRIREAPQSVELMRSVEAGTPIRAALITGFPKSQVLTAEVPPRRSFKSSWLPFVTAAPPADAPRLHLVSAPHPVGTGEWRHVPRSWRKEAVVRYPDGEYRAHIDVPLPALPITLARGVLLVIADILGILLILYAARFALDNHRRPLSRIWQAWRGSIHARLTAALLMFFLIPAAVFGWLAFRALSNEIIRATQLVATRTLEQAASEYQHTQGNLRRIGAVTSSNILHYTKGELSGAALPETRELGVYGAWLPPAVFLRLSAQGNRIASDMRMIAESNILTLYGTMSDGSVLALPMPLNSAEIRQRQREMADLVLFAALLALALSFILSVRVSRVLTRPIRQLQRAAARIGDGDFSRRLPHQAPAEFAQLFQSFNSMSTRLRRARVRQTRTARVLAWGEMARQVAHEIKNPLTPIKMSMQHIRRVYHDRRPNFPVILEESVSQILVEIDRLKDIAAAFSRYGSPGPQNEALEAVDLRIAAQEALTLYRSGDEDVEYLVEILPDVPGAWARRDELIEVLFNLLENARVAVEDSDVGRVSISAADRGGIVELRVEDNGSGIQSDALPRVFDPQFSTRTSGTGLGLAIVKRLVESWGASISVQSELGIGTVFTIAFRRASVGPMAM